MPNLLHEIDSLASPGGWYVMAEVENISGGTKISFLRCINLSSTVTRNFAFTLPGVTPFNVDVTPCHRANLHRDAFWPGQVMEIRFGSFGGSDWRTCLFLGGVEVSDSNITVT